MCQSFRCCKSPTKRTRHGHHLRCTRMRHGGKGKCNVNLSHQKGLMWLSNKMESLTPSLWHLLIRNMNHSFGNGDFVWSWLYSTYKITVIRFICVYIYINIYTRFVAALCHASTSLQEVVLSSGKLRDQGMPPGSQVGAPRDSGASLGLGLFGLLAMWWGWWEYNRGVPNHTDLIFDTWDYLCLKMWGILILYTSNLWHLIW